MPKLRGSYLWRLFIAVDQLLNVIFGGDPDETITSRVAKAAARRNRFALFFCGLLHLFDKNHCATSVEPDRGAPLDGVVPVLKAFPAASLALFFVIGWTIWLVCLAFL